MVQEQGGGGIQRILSRRQLMGHWAQAGKSCCSIWTMPERPRQVKRPCTSRLTAPTRLPSAAPLASCRGVSRFEAVCAERRIELPFDVLSELYDDPTDLSKIEDPHLRMQARALIVQASWAGGRAGSQEGSQKGWLRFCVQGACTARGPTCSGQPGAGAGGSKQHAHQTPSLLAANCCL